MSRNRAITIAILLDGLGWRIANEHGFLSDELPFRGPLATTFGDRTSSLPTILCGLDPREHGQFARLIYSPGASPFRGLGWIASLPEWTGSIGWLRRWIERLVQRKAGLCDEVQIQNVPLHLLPWMDCTGEPDSRLFGPVRHGSGTLFDDLRDSGVCFQICDGETDADKLETAQRDLARGDLEFLYVSLTGLDEFLHRRGTRSPAMAAKLSSYERQVRELMYTAQEHYEEVKVALFSSSGVTDITGECDLMRQVDALGLRVGEDYFAVYDSTMARFWFLNQSAEQAIGAALAHSMDGQWLSENTLRQWGCDFPDRRYGHRFFLLRPGVLLNPSHMARGPRAGMHGYDPWHKDSVAFFASNNSQMGRPAGLANLRDLLAASVGVFPMARRSA